MMIQVILFGLMFMVAAVIGSATLSALICAIVALIKKGTGLKNSKRIKEGGQVSSRCQSEC